MGGIPSVTEPAATAVHGDRPHDPIPDRERATVDSTWRALWTDRDHPADLLVAGHDWNMRVQQQVGRANQRQLDLHQQLSVVQHDRWHSDALEWAADALEDERLCIHAHIGAEPRSPDCHGHPRDATRDG
jgi:hypothetical protein